jgi:N-acetylmuramoyl-L-alanine amidase
MKIFIAKKNTIIFVTVIIFSFIAILALVFIKANFKHSSKNQNSRVIIADAGHGGEDGGCKEKEIIEKHLNLDITTEFKNLCNFFGYKTIMTREKDEAIYDSGAKRLRQKKNSDLHNRLKIIKKHKDGKTVFISIHQNKFPDPKYFGTQIFYSKNDPKSKDLANSIREKILLIQPENKRENKEATSKIFLLNNAEIPAITIECGFISNEKEAQKLKSKKYQKEIAMAILLGVNSFFEENILF